MGANLYNVLIKTHHITSRKKVALLKTAAKRLKCYALLKSGEVPGIMFAESDSKARIQRWVDNVRGLRYKGYQIISPVAHAQSNSMIGVSKLGALEEVSTVKEMGKFMSERGMLTWWRESMGFSGN